MSSSMMLLGLVLVAATVMAGPPAEVGKPAPAFTLTDASGTSHSLADFRGKVVVLEWSNPNCPFVQRVYREGGMTALQAEYAKKGVVWLVMNSTNRDHQDYEAPASLTRTYKEWGATETAILMDTDGTVGKLFEAKTTPHMFIIDGNGVLVYNGGLDDDARGASKSKTAYVRNALDEVLGGKAVTVSVSRPYGCSVKY